MVEAYVKRYKFTETSTQTDDLYFSLTEKKTARMYYSQAYKEKVLSLNFGTCGVISEKNLKKLKMYSETEDNKIYDQADIAFKTPFTMNIIGPSKCGKTSRV